MSIRKTLMATGLALSLAGASTLVTPAPANAGAAPPASDSNLAAGVVLVSVIGILFGFFGGGSTVTSTKSSTNGSSTDASRNTTTNNVNLGTFKIKF